MNVSVPEKLLHESLLAEAHNIDQITETHARTILSLSGAIFAAGYLTYDSSESANSLFYWIAGLGFTVGALWMVKIRRHRQILGVTLDRLRKLHKKFGFKEEFTFDGVRPEPEGRSPDC